MVTTIRIIDHVKQASTYDDGQVIYDLIVDSVANDLPVQVSFAGIQAVPSAFVNSAFLQLLENVSIEKIRSNLRFVDSTKFINELIKRRFDFVTGTSQS